MSRKYKAEEMTPSEFKNAVLRKPVFILTTGILEWHADHLPLGLDALKVRGIAERLSEQSNSILLPQNWFGVVGFDEILGTITFSKSLVKQIAREFFVNMEKMGAKLIVFLTGHYGDYQLETIREVAAEYMAQSKIRIIAQAEYEGVDFTSLEVSADHAGKYETSLAMALFPQLVQMNRYKSKLEIPYEYDCRGNHWGYRSPKGQWAFGYDLRKEASAELGEKIVQLIIDYLLRRIEEELTLCS